MAYVTIEEVASYLAEHGYATWTELTTRQMLTESGMWTRLQSNYDSTHAIDSRYITFPTVDLSAYATEAAMKSWVQSQGYLTSVPSPDLSSYATQAWVLGRGYLTSHQSLDDYATKTWVGMRTSSLASQVWVGNNFVSKATFDELFEKVNIGTEQSPVYVIHAKLGLYSDSFISAGGVGSSGGGGGGGGLTWDNLAAATNEQINVSHLATALSGYLTSYGNRPQIGMAGSSVTWISENYGVILPLVSAGAGNYQLDLGNRPQIGNLSSSGVTWLTASAYVAMPLVYNAGYYQLDLSGYTFLTKESRFYDSKSAFLNAYPNVTDEYGVVKYVAVLAKSGNYRLLAITMADTEGNSFNIYETSSSGQTLLWRSNTTRANEQTTALVWMDPNKSYSITL